MTGNQQVSWWDVHTWVQPYLDAAGSYPCAGTPDWVALADNDSRKWAAVLDAAQHHSLRVDTAQEAQAEDSRAVSEALPWRVIATRLTARKPNSYVSRKVPA